MSEFEGWEIRELKDKVRELERKFYEINKINSDVCGLERSLRQASSDINEIRHRCENNE